MEAEAKIYMVIFHVRRKVFNRYFATRDRAEAFVESLKDEPKVNLERGIYINEEPIDMEDAFHIPKGGRDPQPKAVEVIFTDAGTLYRSFSYGGEE